MLKENGFSGFDGGNKIQNQHHSFQENAQKQEEFYKQVQKQVESENQQDIIEDRKQSENSIKDPSQFFSSDSHSLFTSKKKELTAKQCLKEFSVHHIKDIVTQLMDTYKIDKEKWGSKLFDFVRTAVEQIKPSSLQDDPMDFNYFINIKVINYQDNSKSEYINGIVFSKNIADKRMRTDIMNPKILLINESISTVQSDGTSLQTIIDQEKDWIAIIKNKLTYMKPNIIIVEKDVGYKILDVLREEGITAIINIEQKQMKRISRFIQADIATSYNVINQGLKIGTCSQFKVEEPFTGSKMMPGQYDYKNDKIIKHDFVLDDRSLIYIIGTNSKLGCTILLSGNLAYEKQELKNVKQALREMLKLARNIVLERSFLYQMNCKIPFPFNDQGEINITESPFLSTKNIKNRQTIVFNKVIMKKGIAQLIPALNTHQTVPIGGNMVNTTQTIMNQNISLQQNNQILDLSVDAFGTTNTKGVSNDIINQKVDENYVKRKIDSMCGYPQKEKNTFYVKDKDENECTFGRFLHNLEKLFSQKLCGGEGCKEPMTSHFIQYYHKQGCLEIQYEMKSNHGYSQNLKDYDPKKDYFLIKGKCLRCQKIVTDDTKLSSSLYEYSKARFLEQFFYNGEKLINNNINCNHISLKDIQWILTRPNGNQISFTYIPQEVYSIKMIQPKKEDASELYSIEIVKKQENMRLICETAYFDIKMKMNNLIEYINQERVKYAPAEVEKLLPKNEHLMLILNPLDQIICSLIPQAEGTKTSINQGNSFETDLKFMFTDFTRAISEIKTIFEAIFLERKILINFLTYSKILDETAKVTCLQLTLLKMRYLKHQKNENSQNLFSEELQDSIKQGHDIDMSIIELSKISSLNTAQISGFSLSRKNSHTIDFSNELTPSINQNSQQKQKLFLEEFIMNQDSNFIQSLNQTPNMSNISQANIPLTGKFTQSQNSLDIAKREVQKNHEEMLKELKQKWDISHKECNYLNQQKNFIEDEEKNQIDISMTKEGAKNNFRDGSFSQTINPKSNFQQTFQNTVINPIENLQPIIEQSSSWYKMLNCGFVTMPLGADNIYIPLDDSNIGSILSYALSSNIYKESMIKQNYMDIFSKIKPATKNLRVNLNTTSNIDATIPSSDIRESFSGNQAATQIIITSTPNMGNLTAQSNPQIDEYTKLYGINDVFNYELSPHQIETELLSGEKLSFLIKFSTESRDLTLKIEKNNQHTKLNNTSMQFQSGQYEQHQEVKESKKIIQSNTVESQKQIIKKEFLKKNDLQEKVAPNISKEYMDLSNPFFFSMISLLDTSIKILHCGYFIGKNILNKNESPIRQITEDYVNDLHPNDTTQRDILNVGNHPQITQTIDSANINQHGTVSSVNNQITLESIQILGGIKSPKIGGTLNLPNIPQLFPPSSPIIEEFCYIKSPIQIDPIQNLKNELEIPKVEYEIKIYFAKKFEALRRFYCGTQFDFIQSLIKTQEWTTVTGGKTKSKFYRSFDDKYVFKEIKKNEFNWFIDFAPQYFDYMCKSFFHNYPSALCKILGAFKIKIIRYKDSNRNGQPKITKKYIYITENLNFGIKPEDEAYIVRYDLKGSTKNRFVKDQYLGQSNTIARRVLHDNNFQLEYKGRPLPIRYTINRILHICINNDTMFLSKCNIVDYSLLTIVDKKRKKVRFGIIDYMQMYNFDKIIESKFKRIINIGEQPTVVDPEMYKLRFQIAMKRYFIGMVVQEEKMEAQYDLKYGKQEIKKQEKQDEEEELNEMTNQKYNKISQNESTAQNEGSS